MRRRLGLMTCTVIILAIGILHSDLNIGLGLDLPANFQSKATLDWGYTSNKQIDNGYEVYAEYLHPIIRFTHSALSIGAGAGYLFARQPAYEYQYYNSVNDERYGFIPLYLVGQYSQKIKNITFYVKLKGGYNIFYANEEITNHTNIKNGIYGGLSGGLNLPYNTFLELSYQHFTGGLTYEYHYDYN